MTIKELKEELNKFNDNLMVFAEVDTLFTHFFLNISHASQGINEMDGFLILDDYNEEDD